MKQTLLLVEDDKNLADGLLVSLEQAGYECLHVERIADVEPQWKKADLVILDRQLPDGDSVQHLPEWKKIKDVPVILLTALVTVKDKVAGQMTILQNRLQKLNCSRVFVLNCVRLTLLIKLMQIK